MSNPAITKFMQRKAPVAPGTTVKLPKPIAEEESLISYPKDVTGTVLMCAHWAHAPTFSAPTHTREVAPLSAQHTSP